MSPKILLSLGHSRTAAFVLHYLHYHSTTKAIPHYVSFLNLSLTLFDITRL